MSRSPLDSETIADDLMRRVSSGELAVGGRMPSVKTLCAHYRVGQSKVAGAIRLLRDTGALEVRRRSGCYVTPRAMSVQARPGTPTPPSSPDLTDFLVPRGYGQREVSLFLSELDPDMLATWRSTLEGFASADVRLSTCAEGRAEDVYASRRLDILQATPQILDTLGEDLFVRYSRIEKSGTSRERGQLIRPVRDRVKSGGGLPGVPFSISLNYLYVNDDLAGRVKLGRTEYDSPWQWLEAARRVEPKLREAGARGLTIQTMTDLLLLSGAVSWTAKRGFRTNTAAARELFELIRGAGFGVIYTGDVMEEFVAGRLLFAHHCSFMVPDVMRKARFRWRALPLPMKKGARRPGWLTLLGIRRDALNSSLCVDLVSTLTSAESQSRFGAVHGNVPVLESAVASLQPTAGNELTPDTVRRVIEQTTLCWPDEAWLRLGCGLAMMAEREQLTEGSITAREAVDRFELAFEMAMSAATS